MYKPESVSIIIPVYNEEQGLRVILNRLKELSVDNNWEVIVVDDGSTDNSVEIANSFGFKVLRQPYNKGYGAALKAGIRIASSEILLFMDGDGQHNPDDIPKLLEEMETPLDDFFEEYTELANTSIQKSAKEIDVKVQCFLAKSRSDYKN